jgi:hypothetical protein
MPASRAVTGNLAVFSIGSVASPLSYNPLLEVKSIKPALVSVPAVETTHLLSPNATEEFIPGLIKPGLVSITGNFIGDASQLSILPLAAAQTIIAWKVTAPVDKGSKTYTATGTGYIAKYENGPMEQNKANEFSLDVQITGTITEAVA